VDLSAREGERQEFFEKRERNLRVVEKEEREKGIFDFSRVG